jgi:hypothetical protein
MADESERRSSVQAILDAAKSKFPGQKLSEETLKKRSDALLSTAGQDHQQEAAAFAEEIVRWLNEMWNERQFTVEQRIFSLCLADINFYEHFPESRGGKKKFDEVYADAKAYFREQAKTEE